MRQATPALDRPCPGWQLDLPGPNIFISKAIGEPPKINNQDNIFLEISRNISSRRNITLALGVAQLIASIFGLQWSLEGLLSINTYGIDAEGTAILILAALIFVLAPIFLLAPAALPPRDCPIRFNRMRGRVYVYEFKKNWAIFPTRWRVTTHSFAWEDLRAELWRQRAFTPQGGLIIAWGVSIAVVKSNTNEVINRFPLSVGQDEGSSWDYVRTYMQHGPAALPPIDTVNDPNEVPSYSLALRLAPRVCWPEQMDAESRSGPEDSPAVVQAQHGQTNK